VVYKFPRLTAIRDIRKTNRGTKTNSLRLIDKPWEKSTPNVKVHFTPELAESRRHLQLILRVSSNSAVNWDALKKKKNKI